MQRRVFSREHSPARMDGLPQGARFRVLASGVAEHLRVAEVNTPNSPGRPGRPSDIAMRPSRKNSESAAGKA